MILSSTRTSLSPAKNNYSKVFLLAMVTAAAIFLPFVIADKGYFLFYGDFNVQQIPFYQMTHDAIRDGNVLWNWTTDLGANFIGSYSFYNLGSPFFWLTLPFESSVVPYLMAPLLILKFSCAAVTAFAFVKRFVTNQNFAIIAALLYAFSGFSVYNVFFNHFHEAIIVFPLLLVALEEFMENDRRGLFALAVFASCLINYFFFVGQVVFVVIYWFLRMISGAWKIDLKKFFWLAFEAVLGVLMSFILLLPSYIVVQDNPRTNRGFDGYSALFYGSEQRYGHIATSFFFPPDMPARANLFPKADGKWASVAAWLPLFSMTGVLAFFAAKRGHWLKRIITVLAIMSFIPILNSSFFLFNSSYYARWFYMLVLMMALATAKALEGKKTHLMIGLRTTAIITVAITFLLGFLSKTPEEGKPQTIGLPDDILIFWVYAAIALVSLIVLYILIKYYKENSKRFARFAICALMIVSVVYSIFLFFQGKANLNETHNFIIPYSLNGGKDIDLPDDQNYRIDVMDGTNYGYDNQAMFWQIPSIQAFHSIVPASIMEFYPKIGVERNVASRPEWTHVALRPFLSTRFLFNRKEMTDEKDLAFYTFYGKQNGYYVYENKNYIPLGFTYDQYITEEDFENLAENQREKMLLKAIVLSPTQEQSYAKNLTQLTGAEWSDFSDEAMVADCSDRRGRSCYEFSRDNTGFTAKINQDKENLVFFSVPWEKGWSATVNGKPVALEKVNVGFMAVQCPAGESEIRFNYMTPGLEIGAVVSLIAWTILIGYMVTFKKLSRRRKAQEERNALLEMTGGSSSALVTTVFLEGETTTEPSGEEEFQQKHDDWGEFPESDDQKVMDNMMNSEDRTDQEKEGDA